MNFPDELFVTGTDTGVGKTIVSAMLCAGLKASYWKPIQSGLDEETDTEFVKRCSGLPAANFLPERYRLNTPLSPHASAAIDGVSIDLNELNLPKRTTDKIIVEGAGGLMVPINDSHLILDVITKLAFPVLVVAHNRLGTINHTVLTVERLRQAGATIFGVILNGPPNSVNRQSIEKYGKVRVLAELEALSEFSPASLNRTFVHHFGGSNGVSDLAPVYANENSGTALAGQSR